MNQVEERLVAHSELLLKNLPLCLKATQDTSTGKLFPWKEKDSLVSVSREQKES